MIKYAVADESHISQIVDIWKDLMDYHKELDPFFTRSDDGHTEFEKFVKQSIKKDDSYLVVSLDNKKVIGYCFIITSEDPPVFKIKKYDEIIDMIVIKECREKGIGMGLVKRAVKWAKTQGLERVELKVASINKMGISFWKKAGFEEYMHVVYLKERL